MTRDEDNPGLSTEWAIVEIFGHRRHAGLCSEIQRFGAAMLRIDVFPGEAAEPIASVHYGGASIFSYTPCAEAQARRIAQDALPLPTQLRIEYDDGDPYDDGEPF